MQTSHSPTWLCFPGRITRISLLIVFTFGLSGCNLLKTTLELPEKSIRSLLWPDKKKNVDPVELQSQLLRFADNSIERLNRAISRLQLKKGEPTPKRTILRRRISTTQDILAVVTGGNINANLLDMVILASLNRMYVEDYWIPKYYGESARPYLQASKEVEHQILRIAESALDKEQLSELRNAIQTWHKQHPNMRSPGDVGALGFADEVAQSHRDTDANITGSVFNLLAIDPLAGLDPATRELADTRLFAERGLFLARHMPTLIRWETELLLIQATEVPQLEKLLEDVTQLSASADRFSQTAEQLPGQLGKERQQIVQALDKHQPGLAHLAAQAEKALTAGEHMSMASTDTLSAFQDVVKQLQAFPTDPNGEPFRIHDYTTAAIKLNDTAQNLTRLLQAFDQTLAPDKFDALALRLETVTRQIQTSGKELVDYTFRQILLLLGSVCVMALVSAVVFWKLKKKLA